MPTSTQLLYLALLLSFAAPPLNALVPVPPPVRVPAPAPPVRVAVPAPPVKAPVPAPAPPVRVAVPAPPVKAPVPAPAPPVKAPVPAPAPPVKAPVPAPAPPVKAPVPAPAPPVKAPVPAPAPPVKAPVPAPAPPVKAPVPAPAPPVKAPVPAPAPPVKAPVPAPAPPVKAPVPAPAPPVKLPPPPPPPPPGPLKLTNGLPSSCPTIVQRREIRTYSPAELDEFIRNTLTAREKPQFQNLVALHHAHTNFIHGMYSNVFLIWHRYFLFDYEQIVSVACNKRYVQPYWYWASADDYGDPANSAIFTKLGLGGNGDPQGTVVEYLNLVNSPSKGSFSNPSKPNNYVKGYWLMDGAFAKSPCPYPFKSPLLRAFNENFSYNGKMGKFIGTPGLQDFMSKTDLYSFRSAIEALVHAGPHNAIGGHMLSTNSPCDPLFFLHHGMVDFVFAQWQDRQKYYTAKQEVKDPDNSFINDITKQTLYPYTKVTCGDVMRTEKLCYTYQDYTTLPPPTAQTGTISNAGRNFLTTTVETVTTTNNVKTTGTTKARLVRRNTDTATAKQQDVIRTLANQVVESCQNMKVDPERSVVASYDVPILVPFSPKIKLVPLVNGSLPGNFVDIGSVGFMPRISNFWITLNNLNVTEVEAHYDKQSKLNDKVNSIPGFIPPGAPWNSDFQMDILYKSEKVLCIVVNGTAIASYPNMRDFNDPLGPTLMKSYMLNSIISDSFWKSTAAVMPILLPILGPPCSENVNSASNVYSPRFNSEVGFTAKDFVGVSKDEAVKKVEQVVEDKLKKDPNLKKEEQVVNPMVIQARQLQAVLAS